MTEAWTREEIELIVADYRAMLLAEQEVSRQKGYTSIATPAGPDGGNGLVLRKDGKRYLVQAKHWKSRQVGVKVVRELWGVISAEGAAGGFVINFGTFTDDAHAFAAKLPLDLIDGPALRHVLGAVRDDARQSAPISIFSCTQYVPEMVLPRSGELHTLCNRIWLFFLSHF